jgi:ubiquinone/menaquinone biosynthesis C-methylase UbiE
MDSLVASLPEGFSPCAIADLGAGTGRFAPLLQNTFGCSIYAIEPAEAMLREGIARQYASVEWRQGSAESIPLDDQSIDLVWMSQAFHHLVDPRQAVYEIERILRPGGCAAIRNGTQENNREIEWLRCFPDAAAIDEGRIPSQHGLIEQFTGHRLKLRNAQTVYQYFASSYTEYLSKIRQRGLSALIAISDEAFASGLTRLEHWVSLQPPGKAVYEPVDLLVFELTASTDG